MTERPWEWWCRICGEGGELVDELERDMTATLHVGRHIVAGHVAQYEVGVAVAGRLLHVWCYPRPPSSMGGEDLAHPRL